MRSLLASLTDHPMALLRGIAELRGIALASNARDAAAEQLAAALTDAAATAASLATCSAAGQAAWADLIAAGGRMKTPAFIRRHGDIRPVGPGRLEREQTWQQPAAAAEELWYRGLIFRTFADLGDGVAEYIYIPDELLPPTAAAAPPMASAPTAALQPTAAPERSAQAHNTLAVDLCALLAILRDAPAHLERDGQVRAAELTRLAEGLLLAEPTRLALLIALGRDGGWLADDRQRLVVQTQPVMAWLRRTAWEQMTGLFTAWRDSGEAVWNDLRRVPTLQAEGLWRNDPLLARRAVLGILADLEPGAWYAASDLVAHIKATTPDFQRPDGNYAGWYLRDVATGRFLSGFESWDDVEGRLIRFLIAGPLFWLGAVELGMGNGEWRMTNSAIPNPAARDASSPQSPMAFRLTAAGAAWLRGRMPAALPRPDRLTIADDFTVTAAVALPLFDRFRLVRFTDPAPSETSDAAQDLGDLAITLPTATRHRITRGSLARAWAAGVKAEALLGFLRQAAGGRVPPRVEAALLRWDQHGGAVRISKGAVLRVGDASILATLRADPALAPLLGDLLSAQAALVSEVNLPRVLRALEELGYAVKVE